MNIKITSKTKIENQQTETITEINDAVGDLHDLIIKSVWFHYLAINKDDTELMNNISDIAYN